MDSAGLELCGVGGAGEGSACAARGTPAEESGWSKLGTKTRSSWPTLHIGMVADTSQIVAAALTRKGNPSGQPFYSDLATELVMTLQLVFHLALRQAEA